MVDKTSVGVQESAVEVRPRPGSRWTGGARLIGFGICAAIAHVCHADGPIDEIYFPLSALSDSVRREIIGYGFISSSSGHCDVARPVPSSFSTQVESQASGRVGVGGWDWDGQCLRIYPLTAIRDGRMQLLRDVRANERVWHPIGYWRYRNATPFLFGPSAVPGSYVITLECSPSIPEAADCTSIEVLNLPGGSAGRRVQLKGEPVAIGWKDRYVQIGERVYQGGVNDWALRPLGWLPYRDTKGRAMLIMQPYDED